MTTEAAQAATANLDIATQLAQMQAAIASLQAENQALRETNASEADDFLQQQLKQFEAANVTKTTWTSSPCQHIYEDGQLCARIFYAHVSDKEGVRPEVQGHSFRLTPLVKNEKPKPKGFFSKDEPVKRVDPTESIEETYLSVAQAAKALEMKPAEVRALVADGQLKADKIGRTVLVRKVAVDRLLALAAVQEADEDVI